MEPFTSPSSRKPPHTIIRSPVETAVAASRATGALTGVTGVQRFASGSYAPPVPTDRKSSSPPPQTIIRVPVHAEKASNRGGGAPSLAVASHDSEGGALDSGSSLG
jgi:hypothetical protein